MELAAAFDSGSLVTTLGNGMLEVPQEHFSQAIDLMLSQSELDYERRQRSAEKEANHARACGNTRAPVCKVSAPVTRPSSTSMHARVAQHV